MTGSTRKPNHSLARQSWSRSKTRGTLLPFALTFGFCAYARGNETMEPSYIYWLNPTPQGTVMTAIAPQQGSVDVTGNYDGVQEIGYYEQALPRNTFDRILALVDQVGLENLPASPTLPPDTPVTSVGKIWDERSPPVVRGYAVWQLPKVLYPVMDEFRAQTAALLKHPVRAIHGEGFPGKKQFSLEDTTVFAITLKNVGTTALKLDNPFHKRMEESLTLRLQVRKDKPPAQLREGDVIWIDCKLDHVRQADPKTAIPAGRQITLAAGTGLSFLIRKKLMLTPGRYIAELEYRTNRIKDDVSSMSGTLNMHLGIFEVIDK